MIVDLGIQAEKQEYTLDGIFVHYRAPFTHLLTPTGCVELTSHLHVCFGRRSKPENRKVIHTGSM